MTHMDSCVRRSPQAQDVAAMEADGGHGELLQLARLQANANSKQADFESRKRARLTEDFNSDQGGAGVGESGAGGAGRGLQGLGQSPGAGCRRRGERGPGPGTWTSGGGPGGGVPGVRD